MPFIQDDITNWHSTSTIFNRHFNHKCYRSLKYPGWMLRIGRRPWRHTIPSRGMQQIHEIGQKCAWNFSENLSDRPFLHGLHLSFNYSNFWIKFSTSPYYSDFTCWITNSLMRWQVYWLMVKLRMPRHQEGQAIPRFN